MRVSAGRLKGRELSYPRSGLRPTKDVTRQAIFNIVGGSVAGAKVCDLYAGGGSLGIEALSRGAASAVFVEQSPAVFRFLRENIKGLEHASAVRADVLRALKKFSGSAFDIVLADPPYLHDLVQPTLDRAAEFEALAVGGLFVLEHHRQELPVPPAGWEPVRQGTYGETLVTVLRRTL
jgi:16S rRNA (guanine966-N2)-methyltransferase